MRYPAVLAALAAATIFVLGGAASAAEDGSAQPAAPVPGATEAPSPELVAQGKRLYKGFCSNCHGVNMVNTGTSSFDLRKFPHDDQARFVNSVTRGKNTMPAWGDLLQPDEISAIWAYVLSGGKP